MSAVHETFMEFWPVEIRDVSLPHVEVAVTEREYEALARCHRHGPSSQSARSLEDLSDRIVAEAAPYANECFLRLGYGSWAASQLRAFGTLRVGAPVAVLDVLQLADKRLSTIARRFVDGFLPSVFVRPFLAFDRRREMRVPVCSDGVNAPVWRDPAFRHLPVAVEEADEAIAFVEGFRRALPGIPTHVDIMKLEDGHRVVDINPHY